MRILALLMFLLVACRPSNQISDLVGVPEERPLENTYWVLTELDGKPIATSNESKKLHIQLNPVTKTASGFAGCNQFTGEYTLAGKKISMNNLASTRMFCQKTMAIEDLFLKILKQVDEYQIKEHELFLRKGNQQLAKFQADVMP